MKAIAINYSSDHKNQKKFFHGLVHYRSIIFLFHSQSPEIYFLIPNLCATQFLYVAFIVYKIYFLFLGIFLHDGTFLLNKSTISTYLKLA